ncbi:MAG: N-acetylmuramoyl-L-alanine amidase, partial [Defluviitaleaceae bacterium]|nr:N-acetylmuramoyl-L-alanine amidase [Defluviitaleaceae bacterium]
IGRQNQVPDFIVCHITGGSFTSALNTILNAANQVSYHFVVGHDGAIIQAVNIEDTAWANGTTNSGDNRDNRHSTIPAVRERRRNANQFTVSIGFADSSSGELSAAQLSAGVDLIVHIKSEVSRIYGFHIPISRSNIIGHHEINPLTRANCPGPRFPFDEIIKRVSEHITVGASPEPDVPLIPPPLATPPTTTPPTTTPSPLATPPGPSSWAREAWTWAVGIGITDGTNPQGIPTREQMVTLLHRYHNAFHGV